MGLTAKQRALKAERAARNRAMVAEPVHRLATIETAADLARTLGETEYAPRLQLLRTVRVLGCERARAILAEALKIDADGGELVKSGLRYRTPGGIFFRLARNILGPDTWARLEV
jgi:hypothetical protein